DGVNTLSVPAGDPFLESDPTIVAAIQRFSTVSRLSGSSLRTGSRRPTRAGTTAPATTRAPHMARRRHRCPLFGSAAARPTGRRAHRRGRSLQQAIRSGARSLIAESNVQIVYGTD